RLLRGELPAGAAQTQLFAHKYWPVAFDLHFSDSLLHAMFGPAAVQHAPKGSYPRYFQAAFEHGLMAPGAAENYFLHHVFLGCYRDHGPSLPPYLTRPVPRLELELVQTTAEALPDLGRHDLVSLSNIFDWMSEAEIA